MKKGTRRRRPLPHRFERKAPPFADRRIVPIDDGPLRKRAAAQCKRELAKLDQARAEWRRFEQEDRPAFARWTAATFGALLTKLRENASLINEREAFIEEVELEMILGNQRDPRKAYAVVSQRREMAKSADGFSEADGLPHEEAAAPKNGSTSGNHGAGVPRGEEEEEDDDEDAWDPFERMGPEASREESAAIFEDFLRSICGIDPKHLGKAKYEEMFAEFQANILGGDLPGRPPRAPDGKKAPAASGEARIKETYRILVRRLHPDLRDAGDATVSGLWHDVQEAYQAQNLERLETLLALTEMQSGAGGGQATLCQMRAAVGELRKALRAMQRSIRSAKGDPAWGFSPTANHTALEKRLRRELEESISQQRWVLADLQSTLDAWSRPWSSPARRSGKQRKPRAKPRADRPGHEPFIPEPMQGDLFPF
jgi:hypothetical protein